MAKTINACDDEHLCGGFKDTCKSRVNEYTFFLSSAHMSTTCVCACYQMGYTLQGYAFDCAKYTLGSTTILLVVNKVHCCFFKGTSHKRYMYVPFL